MILAATLFPTAPRPHRPEHKKTLCNPYVRRCEGIFRPAQFPCDTFTAKDLESDNVHKLQSAEESDSNTWEPQERQAN